MLGIILAGLILWAWLDGPPARPRETIARSPQQAVRAADGDSFSIGDKKLRLRGIDAPELHQNCTDPVGAQWPCGMAARAALSALLEQPDLRCEISAYDRFGRGLAMCNSAQTADLAAAQVSQGYAVSHEFHGIADYGAQQSAARAARRGIWRGPFVHPRQWRSQHPR